MGQKTHPNLLKLENVKYWPSKYFERKVRDYPLYSKKDLEVRSFVQKFFKQNGLILKDCKIGFLDNSLHVFISYYQILDATTSLKQINLKEKIHLLTRHLFETISRFLCEKRPVRLIIQKSTNFFKNKFMGKKLVKKLLVRLRRYKSNKFFKEMLNVLVSCVTQRNASYLLMHFIAKHLKYQRSHVFFLTFLKKSVMAIKNIVKAPFKGIKIIIKGRLNNRPWARKKIISIVSNVSYNSRNLDYAEKTVFTPNGSLGIKMWLSEK